MQFNEFKYIGSVIVENYIREVKISNSIRAKYYRKKKDQKDIPLKFCNRELYKKNGIRVLSNDYVWAKLGKDKEEFLYNRTNLKKVIKNENLIGKEKFKVINGQDLHRLTLPDYMASKIKRAIKEQFIPLVPKLGEIKTFPIFIVCNLFDTFDDELEFRSSDWDVDNRLLFYRKVFNDVLTGTPDVDGNKTSKIVIANDHRGFVTGGAELFTPIKKGEVRKLVFEIYHDNREVAKHLSVFIGHGEGIVLTKKQPQNLLFLL